MTAIRKNGESTLSAIDTRLWQLIQHIFNRWGVLVPFKQERYPPTFEEAERRNNLVMFFIPKEHPNQFEIAQFIENQKGFLISKPSEHEDYDFRGFPNGEGLPANTEDIPKSTKYYPGTEVRIIPMIFEISQFDPFVTEQQLDFSARTHFVMKANEYRDKEAKGEELTIGEKLFKKIGEAYEKREAPTPSTEDQEHGFYGVQPARINRLIEDDLGDQDGHAGI